MKLLHLIVILILFVGCDSPNGIVITIPDECGVTTVLRNEMITVIMKAWAQSDDGPLSFDCVYDMYQYEVVCLEDINTECPTKKYGCLVISSYSIYLSKDRDKRTNLETLGHEFIHIGKKCSDGDLDPDHRSGVHWIKTGGDESIEAMVFDEIDRRYADE